VLIGLSFVDTHSSKLRVLKGVTVDFVQNTLLIDLFLSVMMLSTDVRLCTEIYHKHNCILCVIFYRYLKD
jgi:hypothetical protein